MDDGWGDSLEALRLQLERSISSAFDLEFDDNANDPLSVTNGDDEDHRTTIDGNGNSFEILDLIASPVGFRSKWKGSDDVEKYTAPYVPPTTEDLLNNEQNIDQPGDTNNGDDRQKTDEGRIRLFEIHQLEASPIVLRPKKIKSAGVTTNPSLISDQASVTTTIEKVQDGDGEQLSNVDETLGGVNRDERLTATSDDLEKPHSGVDVTDFGSDLVKTHKVRFVTASTSSVTYASAPPPPRRASFLDTSYVNRVHELARLMENQTAAYEGDIHDGNVTGRRAVSTHRGVRRKDEQRSSYVDPDDFRLTEPERRWIICSASSDYQAMLKQLADSPSLVTRRDPVTGLSALHWAAKNGRPDVVKMLFGVTDQLAVDCRTRDGGYTPLHLAATHGRHDVIELLVVVYKADRNAADFSGRLPFQHLMQLKRGTDLSRSNESTPSPSWLRSEALLKPSKKYIVPVELDTPPSPDVSVSRRPSIWTSLTGYGLSTTSSGGTAARRDSMPTLRVDSATDALTSSRSSSELGLMLPPRQLPTVNRRQSVTTSTMKMVSSVHDMLSLPKISENVSHSDNEEPSSVERRKLDVLRSAGSTPDITTVS